MRLLAGILLAAAAIAAEQGQEIRLWPNGAPGSEGETAKEVFKTSPNSKLPTNFTVVHYPSIYVFLPPQGKANGGAVVVAPGGGHSQLVIDKEGWQAAQWLNDHGFAAFVLKYRLAKAPGSHYVVEREAYADSARAVRMVRSRAKEWNVDPARVGFMGFSAGGYLAALTDTKFDSGNASASDPVERVSSRPDFTVIVYPGYPAGSITVPKDAPPAFLVCADNDPSHVVTTVQLYLDLEKQKIPAEMHIYGSGGHGFGPYPKTGAVATWTDRLNDWFRDRGIIK